MIITRSPLRVTFGGGGTDLPSYYREAGGFLVAGAIDKYVYITVHDTFVDDLIIKYSRLERVVSADQVEHPLFREALALLGIDGRSLEISSMADIPAGTGLGSSGSFITALLKALHSHKKQIIHPQDLAEQACHIEIERLGEHVGKQDQYIAAYGGLTSLEFGCDGRVAARAVPVSTETLYNLEDSLLLFFTGYSRSASYVLQEQDERSLRREIDVQRNLDELKQVARDTEATLRVGDLQRFAELLDWQWQQKKARSDSSTNTAIDSWYELGKANGAVGGKLVGAGGGGFLMFYAEDKVRLRRAMLDAGLREVRFRFDFQGTQVVVHS